jgi:hypothetical protein
MGLAFLESLKPNISSLAYLKSPIQGVSLKLTSANDDQFLPYVSCIENIHGSIQAILEYIL